MRFSEFVNISPLKGEIRPIIKALSWLTLAPTRNRISNFLPVAIEGATPKAHDITLQYWDKGSPVYDWLAKHSINWKGGVPPFKDGSQGRVYFLQRYVVKFSGDKVEAMVAKLAAKSKVVAVIDVLEIDHLFAVLQDFVDMEGTPQHIKDAADYLMVVIDNNQLTSFPTSRLEQQKLVLPVLKKFGNRMDLLPYVMLVMDAHIKLFNRTGFFHNDAGPTNVAIHKGGVVFTDLGPNQTSDYDPDTVIKGLKRI